MSTQVLGVLVSGGPAPGINAVIGAATIRAINEGFKVVGIYDGFAGLMRDSGPETVELKIADVSRIHYLGGSILRTDRANPIKEEKIPEVKANLQELGITHLLTIGGDDTASVAWMLSKQGGGLKVIHVPKTIDNDLPLPPGVPTFGFSTACQLGGELAKNLITDAYVTKRFFFVETMGRKTGHLALGIGSSAGVPLILLPEAFAANTKLRDVVNIIAGSIIKRLAAGRPDGVVIYTEGLPEKLDPKAVEELLGRKIPRDAFGHPRWSEVDFASTLKKMVSDRLTSLGIDKVSITNERIGYTLRCADPIPFDRELSRDLGLSAVEQLLANKSNCMVSIQHNKMVCIPFKEIIDPKTQRVKVRRVNIRSHPYQVALQLMIRLQAEDLKGETLKRLAAETNLSPGRFKEQFSPVAGSLG
jgi:6-phosphofructokinase 1